MWFLALACSEYDLNENKVDVPEGEVPIDTAAPRLLVEPESIDFGAQLVGSQTSELVTLTNVGTDELHIDPPTLDSVQPYDVAGDALSLAPGESATWTVSWLPLAYVSGAGELLVDSDGGSGVVTLSADTLRPEIVVSPSSYDFGLLTVGDSAEVEVVIASVGLAPLSLSSLEWTSTSPTELLHLPPDIGDLLYPGSELIVPVRWTPQDDGPEEATLTVWSDALDSPSSATFQANGELPNGPWELSLALSADDTWEGWIDGVSLGSHSGWSTVDTFTETLEVGDHVIAVLAKDTAAVIAGFIASVELDGQPYSLTGDASWLYTSNNPGSGWEAVSFNSSGWSTPPTCANTSPWGNNPSALLNAGAKWIWHSSNCQSLGQAWFRLEFSLS